jgi:hypothetical protein
VTTLEYALHYRSLGLSVIPIRPDGSKAPALASWQELQERLPSEAEIREWFSNGCGIAVVCGAVSRNLEVLDFDSPEVWDRWYRAVTQVNPHALAGIPLVRTPSGGRHLYLFRAVAGPCRKVAKDRTGKKTLVEVKGEGGYVLTVGCPAACHPRGGLYEWEQALAGPTPLAVGA